MTSPGNSPIFLTTASSPPSENFLSRAPRALKGRSRRFLPRGSVAAGAVPTPFVEGFHAPVPHVPPHLPRQPPRRFLPSLEALEGRITPVYIGNGVAAGTVGQFEVDVSDGGAINDTKITAQGQTQLYSNADFLYRSAIFIDVGTPGGAFELATTTTSSATLSGTNQVTSSGSFAGANGTVNWTAVSSVAAGGQQVVTSLTFSSSAALGPIKVVYYTEQADTEIVATSGTPGAAGFRALQLSNSERVGTGMGGAYTAGTELVNATYDGWAADEYTALLDAISAGTATYSVAGAINTTDLPPSSDPNLGTVYGPEDTEAAFAWTLDPTATSATVTLFLQSANGAVTTGTLAGTVFLDADADGALAAGEAGLAGRTVFLDADNDGTFDAGEAFAVTDADGAYTLADVPAGVFVVRQVLVGFDRATGAGAAVGSVTAGGSLTGLNLGLRPVAAGLVLAPNADVFNHGQADAASAVVDAFYQAALGRAPDSAGLSGWAGQLQAGADRASVAQSFLSSRERHLQQVDEYYRVILGRAADSAGRDGWAGALDAGASAASVLQGFLTSDEFTATHATNQAFVDGLYRTLLSRDAQAGEANGWVNALNSGAIDRAAAVQGFLGSSEYWARAVDTLYLQILQRQADGTGMTNWLASAASLHDVARGLLASEEFYHYAWPV